MSPKNKSIPTLSIVVPVCNRKDTLDALLHELSNQIINDSFCARVEVIVVDDASDIPLEIMASNVSLKTYRNKYNLGAPLSRKLGHQKSIGDFIHFHDSDDLIDGDWLRKTMDCLDNLPSLDLLVSARKDVTGLIYIDKVQRYYHNNAPKSMKIKSRLIYRNCMGPLGGVTFSRRVLEKIEFKNFASCQDWQMYIDAIKHAEVLVSRPDIKFIFNKTGDDRISHNPRKKILGHLQLSKITAKESIFKRNIRLFYLYTCKQHIYNKGGQILSFYKKNRIKIFITFLVVSIYWRLT